MAFAFNFPDPETDKELDRDWEKNTSITKSVAQDICSEHDQVQEIEASTVPESVNFWPTANVCIGKETTDAIRILDTTVLKNYLLGEEVLENESGVAHALSSDIDRVEGVYEGGFQLWECALDLCRYVKQENTEFSGKRILEIGCGAAVPGLYALKNGAACVHFQDLNAEVLKYLTIPNVSMNGGNGSCRFFCGDWTPFTSYLEENRLKYDFVLTSETIYSSSSYEKLSHLFKVACGDTGRILVATKSIYFGVGGSCEAFVSYVRKQGVLSVEKVSSIEGPIERNIIELRLVTGCRSDSRE